MRARGGFLIGLLFAAALLQAQTRDPSYPLFLSARPNPQDFTTFATSGWDGNWYVGYNNAWIVKLNVPVQDKQPFARAFIGAKLGRMKTLPPEGRPPVFRPIPGEIWMAISSTTAWPAATRFKLTDTRDIPLEGSPEYPSESVGEAQWFWTEIPVDRLKTGGDYFLALWSPTAALTSVSSAPVLAAAVGGTHSGAWVLNTIKGDLPTSPSAAPGNAITFFQPAIALKLIPAVRADVALPAVRLVSWQAGTPELPRPVLTVSVSGADIERVWTEVRTADGSWKQFGRSLWKAPFVFSLAQDELPIGKARVRSAAVTTRGDQGVSDDFEIEIQPIKEPKPK